MLYKKVQQQVQARVLPAEECTLIDTLFSKVVNNNMYKIFLWETISPERSESIHHQNKLPLRDLFFFCARSHCSERYNSTPEKDTMVLPADSKENTKLKCKAFNATF